MEIKFRAWHYEHNEMLSWEDLQYLSMSFVFGYGTLHKMQFIGLYDKHKNEIYDGDIIKHPIHPSGYYSTVFYKDECSSFMIKNTYNGKEEHMHQFRLGDCEIVGNIYENSNLNKQ